jgi:hypothetical protein
MEVIGAALGIAAIGFIAVAAFWPVLDDEEVR